MRVGYTYFEAIRKRPDRAVIQDEWTERAIRDPIRQHVQADGEFAGGFKYPRWRVVTCVVLLPDGETVHNAFFDRGFPP